MKKVATVAALAILALVACKPADSAASDKPAAPELEWTQVDQSHGIWTACDTARHVRLYVNQFNGGGLATIKGC